MNKILLILAATLGIGPKDLIKQQAPYRVPVQGEAAPPNAGAYELEFHSAIVRVFSYTGGHGTGFFIEDRTRTKYLITAAHVCARQTVMYSIKGAHKVLFMDPLNDTCILDTYQDVDTLSLGSEVVVGDKVHTIGFPLSHHWDIRKGTAGTIEPSFYVLPNNYYGDGACTKVGGQDLPQYGACVMGVTVISAKMMVRPGNSGGPLLNTWGNLVGIVIATNGYGTGYFVPLSIVKGVLKNAGLVIE